MPVATPNRSLLWLAAPLSAALGYLVLASLLNLFLRSQLLVTLELFAGLLIFCGLVLVHTQAILAKAEATRQFDTGAVVQDAMQLFQGAVGIFVRVLIILLKNSSKKRRRRDE